MIWSASVLDGGLSVTGLPAVTGPCAIQMQSTVPARRRLVADQSTITYSSKSGILFHPASATKVRSLPLQPPSTCRVASGRTKTSMKLPRENRKNLTHAVTRSHTGPCRYRAGSGPSPEIFLADRSPRVTRHFPERFPHLFGHERIGISPVSHLPWTTLTAASF